MPTHILSSEERVVIVQSFSCVRLFADFSNRKEKFLNSRLREEGLDSKLDGVTSGGSIGPSRRGAG